MNDGNGRQTSIVYSSPDYRYTGDVYDRNGQHWKYTANYVVTPEDLNTPFLSSVVDPLNRTTSYTWDMAVGKLKTITKPGGEVLTASYDARGNELSTTTTPAGGGSPQIVRRIFPSSCTAATQRSCNKPTAIIDPRGNETDYQWSDVHGGLLTETLPADAAGFRSTNTYSYTAYTGIDGATFYLLTAKTETIDATHSRTTSYEYDVSDHWERKGEVVDVGGLALRTCFKHDPIGNLISKTAPRGGLTSCP